MTEEEIARGRHKLADSMEYFVTKVLRIADDRKMSASSQAAAIGLLVSIHLETFARIPTALRTLKAPTP